MIDGFGSVEPYERVPAADLQARALTDYVGTYSSDEAEVTYRAEIQDDALVLRRRPDTTIKLRGVYADGFQGGIGFVRFHRDAGGKVIGFSISQDRVWDLRFRKDRAPGSTQRRR